MILTTNKSMHYMTIVFLINATNTTSYKYFSFGSLSCTRWN